MTKKLEELFNLESSQPEKVVEEPTPVPTHEEVNSLDDQYQAVQKIVQTLPQIQELENLDEKELDALAKKAEDAYDDIMDLAMQVEPRYSARMFEVATNMLNSAITAKTNKIEKKLKMVDLQLKKLAIDQKNNKGGEEVAGEGYILTDRNSILEKLKNMNK